MECWWNDTDRGKPKYAKIKITMLLDRNLSQCHFTTTNPTRPSLGSKLSLCSKKMKTAYPNKWHSPKCGNIFGYQFWNTLYIFM
jgi:hypothetical protein